MTASTATMPARGAEGARNAPPRARATVRSVIIATLNRSSGDTGVHTHTRALQKGFNQYDISCRVCGPFFEKTLWLPVFAMRRLIHPLNKSWSLRWYRHWHRAALVENLSSQWRAQTPDIVLAQCPVSADAAMEARLRAGRHFPIAMVCHFNRSEADEYRQKGELPNARAYDQMLAFERRVIESVDHVIYVSRWAKQIVEQERGIVPRASSVAWNGIEENCTAPALKRETLGLAPDDLLLVNVGTLETRKNQAGLVELFARICPQFPKARLLLIGDGPDRAVLSQRIKQLGMTDRVRLLGHRRDVGSILPLADVYVHLAQLENCPVALLEAARAALPIAAIPSGGVAELLEQLGGVALNTSSLAASPERLMPLLESSSLRQEMGRRSHRGFVANFTLDAMTRQYIEIFTSTSHAEELR